MTVAELLTRYRETVVPFKRGTAVEEYIIGAMERASFAGAKADRLSVPALLDWRAQRLKLVAASSRDMNCFSLSESLGVDFGPD